MSDTHLRITVENIGPEGGIGISPQWFGVHDGTFDPFDLGEPVPEFFERLAEDANLDPISAVFAASGDGAYQGRVLGDSPPLRGLAPGQSGSSVFSVDATDPLAQYLSVGWMVIPTNDAFWFNDDPTAYALFDANGDFVPRTFVVRGTDVYDAGSEENTEAFDETAALGQLVGDTGIPEGSVVRDHPGLLPPGVPGPGGVLDDPRYALDFDVPGYPLARVTISIDGDEMLRGGDRQDMLYGGFGNDTLSGRIGRDDLLGGDGDDSARGGATGDYLNGGNGDDVLEGGRDTDTLEGGAGDDTLFGGMGGDTLRGDEGDDVLTGGMGADLFVADRNQGNDRVLDFNGLAGDRIALGEDNIVGPMPGPRMPTTTSCSTSTATR